MRNLATVLVTDKESGQSAEVQLDELTNLTNSVVMLSVGPDEIASIEAQSGDLLITLNSGEAIIIAGFFDTPEGERNELVLEDANGILWWGQYDSPWSEFSFAEINLLDEAAKDQEIGWWLIAAGLGGAAAIAAVATDNNGNELTASTSVELDALDADLTVNAQVDNDAASVDVDGTSADVAEGGEVAITITDQNGDSVTATATVDENGDFSVTDIDVSGLTNGPLTIDAVATDNNGNELTASTSVELDALDADLTVNAQVDNDAASGEAAGNDADVAEGG